MMQRKQYGGPERRVHQVYVTHHTEYHVRAGVCVAVKQRNRPDFMPDHGALRMRLEGHVKVGTFLPMAGPPPLGNRMYFVNKETDILTGPVIAILRPPKTVVAKYPPARETARPR